MLNNRPFNTYKHTKKFTEFNKITHNINNTTQVT